MKWTDIKIQNWIIKNLESNKLIKPTIIQEQVIPVALEKTNLIVESPTGSGKTHAFLVPILNNTDPTKNQIQKLIITPTRELATQTYKFVKELIGGHNIKVSCFVGGKDVKQQQDKYKNLIPHIVIGTVTRLTDLYQESNLNLTTADTIVLDECDMLFEFGFMKELDSLLSKMRKDLQYMVFSATINQELTIFLKKYLPQNKIIRVDNKTVTPQIQHIFLHTTHKQVDSEFLKLVRIINPFLCLVFVNSKSEIDDIGAILNQEKKKFALLHGGMSARNRAQIFKKLKNLDYQYLVCTDIGARGIDIPGVSHVISLRLPFEINYYLHRAGRTGRNNATGISYVFYDDRDKHLIQQLVKMNITPEHYKIKNDGFVPITVAQKENKDPVNKEALRTIKQHQATKVKPGYKKAFKQKIVKIEKKALQEKKRQIIKKQRQKSKMRGGR